MAEPPADIDKFDEAIRRFRKRKPITDPEFRKLTEVERERAFWCAGVAQMQPLQEIWDAIDRAIEDGTTLEDFKDEVGLRLTEAWGGEDAPRLETVFRTNIMTAMNAGRHDVLSDPVVREARPYLRFDGVDDNRTCEICAPLEGVVKPADDPFWKTRTPPLHHSCRDQLSALSKEEAHDEGITHGVVEHEPAAEGFGRPPAPNDPGEPNLDQFAPELRAALESKLK
jgi:SPP1 gp7 family putative phage head morphogenesis protein